MVGVLWRMQALSRFRRATSRLIVSSDHSTCARSNDLDVGSGLRLSAEQRTERELKIECLDQLFTGSNNR